MTPIFDPVPEGVSLAVEATSADEARVLTMVAMANTGIAGRVLHVEPLDTPNAYEVVVDAEPLRRVLGPARPRRTAAPVRSAHPANLPDRVLSVPALYAEVEARIAARTEARS